MHPYWLSLAINQDLDDAFCAKGRVVASLELLAASAWASVVSSNPSPINVAESNW